MNRRRKLSVLTGVRQRVCSPMNDVIDSVLHVHLLSHLRGVPLSRNIFPEENLSEVKVVRSNSMGGKHLN